MLRPISPNTKAQYEAAIVRGVSGSEASRRLLRAALKRQALEQGADPQDAIAQVPPPQYEIRRIREFLKEDDARRYEEAASTLAPGRHALALLPLALGLRASSLLELTRRDVERATEEGTLKVLLKRGKEDLVSSAKAGGLLSELLSTPAAPARGLGSRAGRQWRVAGEILSAGKPNSQYRALHELVRDVGVAAGVKDLSPHALRHAFASRMLRDGATIADVQRALGHESPQTTLIYIHGDLGRVGQFMREF